MKIVRNGNLKRIYDDNGKLVEIYSYDTCLFCWYGETPILNITKYSPTTTKQMSRYVYNTLQNQGLMDKVYKVTDIPRGADAEYLRDRYDYNRIN